MDTRSLIITILTVIAITIYFNIPVHKTWLNKRILNFTTNVYDHIGMSLEQRREYRWGAPYVFFRNIKQHMDTLDPPRKLVLLPPELYYKQYMPNITLSEPVICYYYSGLRTTTVDCDDVREADGCVYVHDSQFMYETIDSASDMDKILDHYKANSKENK